MQMLLGLNISEYTLFGIARSGSGLNKSDLELVCLSCLSCFSRSFPKFEPFGFELRMFAHHSVTHRVGAHDIDQHHDGGEVYRGGGTNYACPFFASVNFAQAAGM
jgi:hypothetical protein